MLERQMLKTLSRDSGLSIDTLKRNFCAILPQAPTVLIIKRRQVNLRIDGTYFKQFCLICCQDELDGYTQLIRFVWYIKLFSGLVKRIVFQSGDIPD
jgi:hypothetical protein